MPGNPHLLVVAIDINPNHSRNGFSFYSDYVSNPPSVFSQNFVVGDRQMTTQPTSVLFNPDRKFHSFGYEAEEMYAKLFDDNRREAVQWFFFKRFKLNLHNYQTLSRELMLADQTKKKEMPALDVFSAAIGYMKKHISEQLKNRKTQLSDSEVTWVLTVPATSDYIYEDFMHDAARKAGISPQNLMLVSEPMAASIYILRHFKSSEPPHGHPDISKPGKKMLLVRCKGETTDVSAFEVQRNKLHLLHHSEEACQGGAAVDQVSATTVPQSIRKVLAYKKVGPVDAILLAEGLSESDVIQNAVKEAFPRDLVLVAPSLSDAVLIGAVMYGHNSDVIYGTDTMLPFKEGVHDKRKLFVNEAGERWCIGCFSGYIRDNEVVEDRVPLRFRTVTVSRSDQTELVFNIYRSFKTEPLYVDEMGVKKVATLSVPMLNTSDGLAREIQTRMEIQKSGLTFIANNEATGEMFTTAV